MGNPPSTSGQKEKIWCVFRIDSKSFESILFPLASYRTFSPKRQEETSSYTKPTYLYQKRLMFVHFEKLLS